MTAAANKPQRWVFIGDSITDTGRREDPEGYGDGYVSRIREQLLVDDPACPIEFMNRGVSGDTVRDLRQRWQSDVTALKPDLLSVKIGVNDVWRSFDGAPNQAVNAEEYRATLRGLLGEASILECRLVLVTPFLVEVDKADPMRLEVENRARIVGELADEFGAVLVALQPAFDAAVDASTPQRWAPDRVHPSGAGHLLIAQTWLSAVRAAYPD
ncbi:SGNH/GDSL hydrolase family protein [Deinococcus detaillensis]|uniref:SGNH/GDSL hydrolase family protein n=1 Tax=Deinococcus detaillensis TaxID=2592048 RepID=A0A553ULN0_9DEIO|nr:SGNH/GDSL hydrolase family protein [Deinococcus detaillensis]TSA81109.1 SGNH/GDSL hydrolase family protein [Deinococcus detaillensis]